MQSDNDIPAVVSFADFIKNQDFLPDVQKKQPSCKSHRKEKKLANPKKILKRKESNAKSSEKLTSSSRNTNNIKEMLSQSNKKYLKKEKEQKSKTQKKRKCEGSDDDIKITKIIPPKSDCDLVVDEAMSTDEVRIMQVSPAPSDGARCDLQSTRDCTPHLNRITASGILQKQYTFLCNV